MESEDTDERRATDAFSELVQFAGFPPEFASVDVVLRASDTTVACWRAWAVLIDADARGRWQEVQAHDAALRAEAAARPPDGTPLAVELAVMRAIVDADAARPDEATSPAAILAIMESAAEKLHGLCRRAVAFDALMLEQMRAITPGGGTFAALRVDHELAADLREMVRALVPPESPSQEALRLLALDDWNLVREWAGDRLVEMHANLTQERTAWLRRSSDWVEAHRIAQQSLHFVLALFGVQLDLVDMHDLPLIAKLELPGSKRIALFKLFNTDGANAVRIAELSPDPREFLEVGHVLYETAAELVRDCDTQRFRMADHNRTQLAAMLKRMPGDGSATPSFRVGGRP